MSDTTSIDPLALFAHPARLGALGAQARQRAFGDQVWVRHTTARPMPAVATLTRDETSRDLEAWPEPDALSPGDRVLVQVSSSAADRERFVAWLRRLAPAAPADLSLAPCSAEAGGMHRLWCIGAARVLLPPHVHVEARHDLVGIRLAQLAVGFGADTLAGPVEADRKLPLAGVTRPDENTTAGLTTLVRQVGLVPQTARPEEGSP